MNLGKRKADTSCGPDFGSKTPKMNDSPQISLNVDRFASSRVIEIQALTELVKNVGGNHQAFQKLPPHLRRRAMSHNIKRVPRRLHDVVKSELDKVKSPMKRPSRKYRRKPSNLLAEYEQRKRKFSWLDTHIWHAKRFKMVEAHGYKLPYHPTDKSIRSCYRAVKSHCLIQDVSYESYIEIEGEKDSIISGLRHLTSEETGPTFEAKMTSSGCREGSLYLYKYDSYPRNVIGRVTYLWFPEKKGNIGKDSSILWICCHPSYEIEALAELKKCFAESLSHINRSHSQGSSNYNFLTDEKEEVTNSTNISTDKISDTSLVNGKDDASNRNIKFKSEFLKSKITTTSLRSEIVKFRLFGPASNSVLRETLELWNTTDLCGINAETNSEVMETSKTKCAEVDAQKVEDMWWKSFYNKSERQREIEVQKEMWSEMLGKSTPAEAPPHLVLAVTVRDPRLKLPPKRNKVFTLHADSPLESVLQNTNEASISALWDRNVRENVKATKIAEKTLNGMKSKHFIPGTRLELGEKESRIPIVLIQRPGCTDFKQGSSFISNLQQCQIGYGCGWDILIPRGWAMAFWMALVYRGARAGGQREARSVTLQAHQLVQVRDVPDSVAGKTVLEAEASELQTKHDKQPPAKRPNYIKLGFDSPFVFPFSQLCKEWSKRVTLKSAIVEEKEMYVLRHRRSLKLLDRVLTNPLHYLPAVSKIGNIFEKILSEEDGKRLIECHSGALLPVAVKALQRGVPVSHAHICIPSKEDFQKLKQTKSYRGPEESIHVDKTAPQRKAERKKRLQLRKKKKSHQGGAPQQKAGVAKNIAEVEKGLIEVGAAPEGEDLINMPSRQIIGYLTGGDYELSFGKGSGMGFCSVAGLLHLIEAQQLRGNGGGPCICLVRNPTSRNYMFVAISVVL